MQIRIFDINRHRHSADTNTTRLGFFTAEMNGIRFTGCSLVEHSDGTRKAYLPRGYKSTNGVSFYDRKTGDIFTLAAVSAFKAQHFENEDSGLRRMLGAENEALEQAGL